MKKYPLLIVLLALILSTFLSGAQGQIRVLDPFGPSINYYSSSYPFHYSYINPSFYPTYLPYRFYGYPYLYPFGGWDDWWGMNGGFFGPVFGMHEGFEGHDGHGGRH